MNITSNYEMVIFTGSVILVLAFFFQTWKILSNGKNTFNFSKTSWIMNFSGRVLLSLYGILVSDIVFVVSQGIMCIFNIPIIYYLFRNFKTKGKFVKENFSKRLLFWAYIAFLLLVLMMVIGSLVVDETIAIVEIEPIVDFIIPFIGTFLTGFAFFPQGLRVLRNKNTKSISLLLTIGTFMGMFLIMTGVFFKIIATKKVLDNIAILILPWISLLMMLIITKVKIKNVFLFKEKII